MRPPHYIIHSQYFPDGREEHRVEKGRKFLFWIDWITEWGDGFAYGEGSYKVRVFRSREQAQGAIELDWQQWLSEQPAIRQEATPYDPEH